MKNLGFIGAGNMAEALIRGLIEGRIFKPADLIASDADLKRRQLIKRRLKIETTADNRAVVHEAAACLIAVKPQQIDEVLADALRFVVSLRIRVRETFDQAYLLGVQSWPIVLLTSLFTGMVFSLDSAVQAVNYGVGNLVGGVVAFCENGSGEEPVTDTASSRMAGRAMPFTSPAVVLVVPEPNGEPNWPAAATGRPRSGPRSVIGTAAESTARHGRGQRAHDGPGRSSSGPLG